MFMVCQFMTISKARDETFEANLLTYRYKPIWKWWDCKRNTFTKLEEHKKLTTWNIDEEFRSNLMSNLHASYGVPSPWAYCHCIVQKGIFCCLLSVGDSSDFGDSGAASCPLGGSIVCHLSANVDTIGALAGLFPSTFSSSDITVVFNFGTNCNIG